MTTHGAKRLRMSSIQYAWGKLPPGIFPDKCKTSLDVSETQTRVLNLSGLSGHPVQGMSQYPKLSENTVLSSQNIENENTDERVTPHVESDHPYTPFTIPKNDEATDSVDASIIAPKPREMTFEHLDVSGMKCLTCGCNRVVFVNENGQIFVQKGSNDTPNNIHNTECGDGNMAVCMGLIDSLSAHKIISVSCGERHTVALPATGQVYAWGDNTYGQLGQDPKVLTHSVSPVKISHSRLEDSDTSIVQIASGTNFNVILTETGDLYAWGKNNYGQLGFGTECELQWSPQHLDTLRGLCIVHISCGEFHCLCLTISGSVFGWGRNQYGQLGVGTTVDCLWPKKLKTLQHQKITTISCGDTHSVALSKDGKIYSFGNGEHGQLGHNSTKNETLPKVVMDLMGDHVTHVACGRAHTVVNVRSTSRETDFLYSFGSGSNGQLGQGELNDSLQPVRLKGIYATINLTEYLSSDTLVVDTLVAGGDQSYVRFASKNDVENVQLMTNSKPLLLTHMIVHNYNYDSGRRQLKKIVSSANCLNGSFLCGDKHYSCTTKSHGIDLHLAEDVLTKLDELPDISLRNEITDLIAKQLIPSLNDSPPDIESMRLYLTLPLSHPFQDPRNTSDILAPFARKVLELTEMPSKIIRKWWTSIPCRNFIWMKNIYQQGVTNLVCNAGEVESDVIKTREHLVHCVEFLKRLYEINQERETTIPYTEFYISVLNDKVNIVQDAATKIVMDLGTMEREFVFCNYPFMFDMTAKSTLLKATSHIQKQGAVIHERLRAAFAFPFMPLRPQTKFVLRVQRHDLVISTMIQLEVAIRSQEDMAKPLHVIFDGEEGIDDGGITKEFFLLLQDELLSPDYDIFEEDENSHLIWFKSEPQSEKWNMVVRALNGLNAYEVLGAFCSLAINNSVIVDFHFPTALYKKILKRPTSLADLVELNPDYNSFYRLLDMPEDDVEYMEQYFEMNVMSNGTLKTIELIPNGSQIQVNAANRKDYVDKYVDYLLNKSVKDVFEKFQQGFLSVFQEIFLQMFRPEEIQELVIGNTKYDWETLQKSCVYMGYTRDHETIKYFWEVFMEFDEEEKKKFLLFLTGSTRIPIAGMKAVPMTIDPLTHNEDFLPTAHTCFNLLHLPVYKSKEVLKNKLSMAICVTGFGMK